MKIEIQAVKRGRIRYGEPDEPITIVIDTEEGVLIVGYWDVYKLVKQEDCQP